MLIPICAFLVSRPLRFIAAKKKPFMEHLAFSVMVRLPVPNTNEVAAFLTCRMSLQRTQLVRTVRVFVLLSSAVVLVDLQFGVWPCLFYGATVSAILVVSSGLSTSSKDSTLRGWTDRVIEYCKSKTNQSLDEISEDDSEITTIEFAEPPKHSELRVQGQTRDISGLAAIINSECITVR